MGSADLHLHSTASDGCFPPREVMRRAHGVGLAAVSLTDHDTVAGLAEAEHEARRLGLLFVPGCEISIEHRGLDIHLLAYFVDPHNQRLLRLLKDLHASREDRVCRMVRKIGRLGFRLQIEDVRAEASGSAAIGRPHVAQAMVRRGFVGSPGEAFELYIGTGRKAYVPKETPDARVVVGLVWSGGGVPVLAHPGLYGQEDPEEFFRDWELGGIETDHPSHHPEIRARLDQWARRRGIPATAGSDWHGSEGSRAYVGCRTVGLDVIDALRALRRPAPDSAGTPASLNG